MMNCEPLLGGSFYNMQLSDIRGFGPKRIELLEQMHIRTAEDILRHYPREYLNYSETDRISDLQDGDIATLKVHIISDASFYYYKGRSLVTVRAKDKTGQILLRWINQPYRTSQVKSGTECFVHGRVSKKRGTVIYNPTLEYKDKGIVPVYSLAKGISQSLFRQAVEDVLEKIKLEEMLPESLREKYDLLSVHTSMCYLHFPQTMEQLEQAKRRIILEQAFFYFLAIKSIREESACFRGYAFETQGILEKFLSKMKFEPTEAQLRVMHEVENDMGSENCMNRLIQGDVGCGKTLIAEYALSVAAACGKQGVLLVPTEILAEQHYHTLRERFSDLVVLYSGSLSASDKRKTREKIKNGDAVIIVGTHAVLSDKVVFSDLGLIVTDEQHRFGVSQRAKLESKAVRPDVLVMSATPIPRTLALLLYSDLHLSVINEMPAGRKPIRTMYVPKDRRIAMYQYIAEKVKQNERAFVVCPVIEPTEGFEGIAVEEVYEELINMIPSVSIGLIHGQMRDEEKKMIMLNFQNGTYKMLISTTVIEVGVDIPRATYMVIEGAEHFGLATLHQLRGRIGRNDLESSCYLLCNKINSKAKERIQTMIQSNDGFYIAQKDMEQRGYGDLFGIRQSGEGAMSELLNSCTTETLEAAIEAADMVMSTPTLTNNELVQYARDKFLFDSEIAFN